MSWALRLVRPVLRLRGFGLGSCRVWSDRGLSLDKDWLEVTTIETEVLIHSRNEFVL